MQLGTRHTHRPLLEKTLLALSIRTNPSYSSEHVKDNVFVVAYAALASVPGRFSMKHDTSCCISFRLFIR